MRTQTREVLSWVGLSTLFLGLLNAITQSHEEGISMIPRATPFYLDYVWYLDDIIGPALMLGCGLYFVVKTFRLGSPVENWPLLLFGLFFVAAGLGDSVDIHWVVAESMAAGEEAVSFSSWVGKVCATIGMAFVAIYAWDFFNPAARKGLLLVTFLIFLDQIIFAITLDFAGYAFHVFEESLEVIAALYLLVAVTLPPLEGEP